MKIQAKEAKSFLGNPGEFQGALVYGTDRGQVRQRVGEIIAKLLINPNDPFNKSELTNETLLADPARLADELAAMSFTGERRVIELRDVSDKVSDIIASAVDYLSPQNFLLVWADELPARSPIRALFEKQPKLASFACYKDEGAGLSQLVRDTLRGYGLKADSEVVTYLSEHLSGDRMIILSELEKISLYYGEDTELNVQMVRQIVGDPGEHTLDDICEAVADGQIEPLCRCLDRLYEEGMQPVVILRSVSRYFGRLLEIQMQQQASGQSIDSVIKSIKPMIFFKQQPILARHATRWRSGRLRQAQQLMLEAEYESKLGGDLGAILCTHALMRAAKAA